MKAYLTEDYLVEQSAINWFKEIGYEYVQGSELIPEKFERESYRDVILKRRFINAIKKINPWVTVHLAEEVYKKVRDLDHPDFVMKGKIFYELLTNGVKLTFKEGKEEKTRIVKLIDFENPDNNDFLISNQFKVEYQFEKEQYRRPDLVVFINGLSIAVFEFKNFNADETAKDAFMEHKAKIKDIPQLYVYAQFIVASDGLETKYGAVTSDWDRFFIWEGIEDDNEFETIKLTDEGYLYRHKGTGREMTSLEVLIRGLCNKRNLIEYLQDFIFYDKEGERLVKKIAMYHQFYAVKKAIKRSIECAKFGKTPEDRRIGVIWHTQGSGKSLTMYFYAKKALKEKELDNPLLIFVTDRTELDEQLYGIFSEISIAKRAENIEDLKETIKNTFTGIIFTTIQKFGKKKGEEYPLLTERRNIIIIADEAHRSQYRDLARNLRKAIPKASFMGFTATPIELADRDTYLVFGEPISIYTMDKGIRHRVIVPIYYEARLAEIHLTNEFIDEEFEEISEKILEDQEVKEALKAKFARLENLMLAEDRLEKVARDIVEHFKERKLILKGKALVVTISRKVAVKLYQKLKEIDPSLSVVVVISGDKTKDPEEFHPHIRTKYEHEEIRNKFKNPDSELEMAIVVDMWLTGFDVPCLHTMYFDKPMKGHTLMQAIARVNRVFKDKPGGLIVDYIGIADNLKKSLGCYLASEKTQVLTKIEEVLKQLRERYDIINSLLSGINYKNWTKLSSEDLSKLTILAYQKITSDEEIQQKFLKNYLALKKAFALASPHPETIAIKDDLKFFEMLKKMIVKYSSRNLKRFARDLEYEINQLISKSISAQEPVDVFTLLEKEKPDISILDEEFLLKFKDLEFKNYSAEVLFKLLKDELRIKVRKNPIRYESLYERLKKLIENYNKKLITAIEVIEHLLELAKEYKEKYNEGKLLNLSEEEILFYDYLLSKKEYLLEDKDLRAIAKEIANVIGPYVKIADWNKKETIKAKIRTALKLILPKYIKIKDFKIIDEFSQEILEYAESFYAMAA
ncbi:MAG: restriction endonuclease subunit R [Thermodesulfobacterium geofontis]|uniref:Type I restriction enzyme endonuclease subunit n=2 Tax=Thermodesulfobacterium geofontis TaxID=1295609 RepID=A0A2N7PME9_9BACT|nr:MAG: restriction endonuclease subunit R [Thermodesulfobacterium geofontis]